MMRPRLAQRTIGSRLLHAAATLLLAATPVLAIQPGHWVHNTEADFNPGKNEGTVVTNLGDVKLAMASKVIGQIPEEASIIYDLQPMPNGDIYIAAGPEAKLLRRHGDKIEEVLSLPGEQIFSLDLDAKGRLLVAVSGVQSRLAVLEGNKLSTLIELDGVRYVWDMLPDGQLVYLATGTEGKLLRVDLAKAAAQAPAKPKEVATKPAATEPGEAAKPHNPAIDELLDATQANLLCLGRDKQGRIYVGTDTDGLVIRLTFKADGSVSEKFVLYDAAEPEIGALVVMPDGTVYAGTADAEQAKPGRLSEAASTPAGRPEVPEQPEAKPEQPPKVPEPGEIPSVPPSPTPIGGDKKQDGKSAPAKSGVAPKDANRKPNKSQPAQDQSVIPAPMPSQVEPLATDAPANGDKAAEAPAEPTKEQRDELRQVIRQRLEQARRMGTLQASPAMPRRPVRPRPAGTASRPAGPNAAAANVPARKEGNAIYRISPDGFVTEIFRESVMILKMIPEEGKLIVATGNEGEIFRVDPVAGETTMLADLEPQQVPAMLRLPDGGLLLGTANAATLVRLDAGFAKEGKYTSVTLDASQISLWGTLDLTTDIPDGATVAVETRSGNVQDPEHAAWSSWSKPHVFAFDPKAAPLTPRQMVIDAPPARFLQYRLTLTGNGQVTGVVDRVAITYVLPNLKPVINTIQASYPDSPPAGGANPGGGSGGANANRMARPSAPSQAGNASAEEPEPQTNMNIEWEASDPNGDQLRYTLEYQPAGSKQWLPLAKDIEQNSHEWQTRRVPDGRYIIRVTASDSPDNPSTMALTASRRSDPIVVDNTPPAIEEIKVVLDKGNITITGRAHDALSNIKSIHYGVDSTERWQPVLPDDLIYDSTTETFTIKITGLSVGPHMVTLRVLDARNNARYEAVPMEVK